MTNKRREFEIELGTLVMQAIAEGTKPDDIIAALEVKTAEEKRIRETRRAFEKTY